ncbi:MAG: hypothetical protein ACLS6W_06435 [Ruminococcus sp.]
MSRKIWLLLISSVSVRDVVVADAISRKIRCSVGFRRCILCGGSVWLRNFSRNIVRNGSICLSVVLISSDMVIIIRNRRICRLSGGVGIALFRMEIWFCWGVWCWDRRFLIDRIRLWNGIWSNFAAVRASKVSIR